MHVVEEMLMIYRIGLWNDAMEKTGHMNGLTSLGKSANRLYNFWHYTLNQKGYAGFKISAVLDWITMLFLRAWIILTGDPFVKKVKHFFCLRLCLFFCDSGLFWMR
jgi:hypothetical protein